jgi:hypothetical protein
MGKACSSMGRRGMRTGILGGKPEGKRPLGRRRRKRAESIKLDLRAIGWGDMGWIDLSQDWDQRRALVNTVMNLRVP